MPPSTPKQEQADEMNPPSTTPKGSPVMEATSAEKQPEVDDVDDADDVEPTYQLPTPRPTSIFMNKFEGLLAPGSPQEAKAQGGPQPTFLPRPRVESLYDSGARIWKKEDLARIEGQVKAIARRLGDFRKFPFRCIDNSIVMVEDINPCFVIGTPTVVFRMYQDIVYSMASTRDKASLRGLAICSQIMPTVPNVALTEHQIHQLYLKEKEVWEASKACADLKFILSGAKIPAKISRMVCFGLGTFESGYMFTFQPTHHRSIVQHCAALTMAEVVQRKIGKRIQVYAQDPAYSFATKRILAREEVRVIDGYGALGFTFVDDDTFVFSVHPDVPVKQVVADLAKPAVMVWDKVSTPQEEKAKLKEPRLFNGGFMFPWTTDNDSPRTQALVKGYKETEFPDNKGHFTPNLSIYVRKN